MPTGVYPRSVEWRKQRSEITKRMIAEGTWNRPRRHGPHTEETKKKMSISQLGHEVSEETRKRISKVLTGRTLSADHPARRKGKKLTAEHRAKIGQAQKGKILSPESIRKMVETKRAKYLSSHPEALAPSLPRDPKPGRDTRGRFLKGVSHTLSPDTLARNGAAQRGKQRSPEYRERCRQRQKQLWSNPEFKAKMIAGFRGRKLSPEHKAKISRSLIGNTRSRGYKHDEEFSRKISERVKGHVGSWKGKKRSVLCPLSETTKRRMSEEQKGPRGSNWKGGLTPINKAIRKGFDFAVWRKAIFERDNYTCQKCNVRGGRLHPHHILNFTGHPELRFLVENGVTLCKRDHDAFHKSYGYRNNTREQLEEFLNADRSVKAA